ncbi:hypothetical protein T4E_2093 [Trichinella pseudospiralis]|uniref:Uncharacterized protein n=1 Tax=Trichinella pseudospiralis TaxID=6337 RepID=A0A0V0XEL4_TRIPS|nr:hypothetical protein T4E_2093 [Trichinella pseudospiralis]
MNNIMVTTPNNKDSEKCLKTAIAIPFSLYEYTRMQFSLRNEEVSQALRFLDIYIDDVLVAYPIDEVHEKQYSVNLNLENFSFHLMNIRFLRLRVCRQSTNPLEKKL